MINICVPWQTGGQGGDFKNYIVHNAFLPFCQTENKRDDSDGHISGECGAA